MSAEPEAQALRPLPERAESYVEWALTKLAHAGPPRSPGESREAAMVQARAAEAVAMLALAESQRALTAANEKLAASYDALVDEMRARRGVREEAA